MRLAIAYSANRTWPKMKWVADAASSLGHDVVTVRSPEELRAADESCDLVLFEQKGIAGLGFPDILEFAPRHRAFWVQWIVDLMALQQSVPLEHQSGLCHPESLLPSVQLKVMRAMDLVLIKERGLLAEYDRIGVNAIWFDQGCPSWMPSCEHREIPEWDVLFFGTMWEEHTQRRSDIMSLLTEGFSVAWAGHLGGLSPPGCLALGWHHPSKLPELASRAACVLCVDHRSDVEGYWSDRLWLALGMGACVVRRDSPGLPQDAPMYRYVDGNDLCMAVSNLRRHREHRELMGTNARLWTLANHTYESRVKELVRLCEHRTLEPVQPVMAAVS